MWEDNTVKNSLLKPLRDKTKLMKVEHLLSNTYVLIGILGIIDLLIFFLINYGTHILKSVPSQLFKVTGKEEVFSIQYLFPEKLSFGGILVFLIILGVIDCILYFQIKVSWSEEYFNVGQKGKARFATEEEIKQQYLEIDPLETPYPGMPGTLVCRIGDKFYIDQTWTNNLYIGITRSGKDEMGGRPNAEIYTRAKIQPSIIFFDPKLERYKSFKKKFEERGYDTYLMNCSDPRFSMGFNPVTVAVQYYKRKDYDAEEAIINATAYFIFPADETRGEMLFFVNSARDLFTAMVLAAVDDALTADIQENQERMESWKKLSEEDKKAHPFQYRTDNEKTIHLYSMIINFGLLVQQPLSKDGSRTELDRYFECRPAHDPARLKYLGTHVAPGKTKSSIFAEMLEKLSVFMRHDVARMTTESTLDFKEIGFGKKPVAVFLAIPSYDDALYKLPTIFVREMYYVLGRLCDKGNGKCDRPVKIDFNEAGNMPAVPLMKVMTTMGLGQNISFDFYIQNYEQLTDVYGDKIAETIKGNCGNHFFIQTKSRDTAKAFSELLNNKSRVNVQRSGGKISLQKYFSETVEEEPLARPDDLMMLQEGECVIHRTSKRQDLEGKKVIPYPIFNSIENGHYFWYSYEYFPEEEYPNPNTVNLYDICTESRMHIEPRKRIFDIEKSYRMRVQVIRTLNDLDYQKLRPFLVKSFGENFEMVHGIGPETTIAEALAFVNEQEIPEAEKDTIRDVLLR